MILAGNYRAQAVDGHLSYTSKGNEQVVVKLVIAGGPQDGQHITWFGFFSDACFDRTIQSLRYCGWKGDDVSALDGLDANEVEIVVEHSEYKGKVTPTVRWINQAGGGAGMSPVQARDFAESVKGRIAGMTAVEPEPDGDVPF
jgi:hypothetical protein